MGEVVFIGIISLCPESRLSLEAYSTPQIVFAPQDKYHIDWEQARKSASQAADRLNYLGAATGWCVPKVRNVISQLCRGPNRQVDPAKVEVFATDVEDKIGYKVVRGITYVVVDGQIVCSEEDKPKIIKTYAKRKKIDLSELRLEFK